MSIFGDLEQFAADLYPYRWPITIGLLLAFAAAGGFAYRMGWHLVAWRHKLSSGIVTIAVLAVAVPLGNYLLSPLWERSFLEEASPLALTIDEQDDGLGDPPANATSAAPAEPTPAGIATSVPADVADSRVVLSGEVSGEDDFHFGRGTALLIETAPGEYTLRFEEFSVRNGPDLFVYLSPSPDGYAEGAINLGELKATDGAFNYDVPLGTDISQYKSAVIWCRQFSVEFASAPLEEV